MAKKKEPAPAIKFPEWIDGHPAVKMFQKMRLKDFAMICHFFGYLMIPEAKLKHMVEAAASLKKVKPNQKEIKRAVKGLGVLHVNNKGVESCRIGRPQKKKLNKGSRSGTRKRTSR